MPYPNTRPVAQLYRPASTLRIQPRTDGNYRQQCNVVYAEAHGFGLVMDVFSPESAGNGLGIVDVVSGAWFSDRVVLNAHIGLGLCDVLCARGYTVFAVAPGSVTKFTGRDMLRHVHEAIRNIKVNAPQYGIDPGRLGLTGASAGGHLAALAALHPKPGRPAANDPFRRQASNVHAVALLFPPTDLVEFGGQASHHLELEGLRVDGLLFEDGLENHSSEEIHERLTELSPARQVRPVPPPFMLLHGDADPAVPLRQSELLAEAIRAAGGEARLLVKPGGGHPWPGIRAEIEMMADWLDARLNC